jgi:ribosome recycling factor
MPLKHCATISIPDARSIMVSAHDKSIVGDIRKAIETSDIGVTPNVDGGIIRLSLPPLNEERRKELVKLVHKRAEDGRIAVRNIRKDGHNHIQHAQRDGKVTEDEGRRGNEQVQKLTDKFVAEVDSLVQNKEKEIMEV